MKRTTLSLVALATLLAASGVSAQEIEPGYDPSGALPSVSLPQRNPYPSAVQRPATQSPEASTTISRSGGTTTATDMLKAPEGALKAAAATQPAPQTSQPGSNGEGASRYLPGMTIYGKATAYDGHSLLVDGNPIRLNGVEAPGAAQLCTTAQGVAWRCGRKAFEKLASLVSGRNVKCVVSAPAGHGAAAVCSASQVRDIGALMVSEGLAVPNRHSAGAYAREMQAASGAGRGMWMGGFTDPAKWRLENR